MQQLVIQIWSSKELSRLKTLIWEWSRCTGAESYGVGWGHPGQHGDRHKKGTQDIYKSMEKEEHTKRMRGNIPYDKEKTRRAWCEELWEEIISRRKKVVNWIEPCWEIKWDKYKDPTIEFGNLKVTGNIDKNTSWGVLAWKLVEKEMMNEEKWRLQQYTALARYFARRAAENGTIAKGGLGEKRGLQSLWGKGTAIFKHVCY